MEGHVTYNNMIDYIKHSACTDFTIHSTCTSGGQAFRFTQIGALSQMYGGASTGDDLQIIANDTDTYPYIKLLGDSDAEIQVKLDKFFWFSVNAIKTVRFGRDSNDCQIKGGDNTIRNLSLWANTIDAYPYIKLEGSGDVNVHYNSARDIFFYEQANERFAFYEHSIDFNADRAIYINDDNAFVGHGAGDNIAGGNNNTLVGHDAGQANSFSSCAFLGYEAGKSNTQNNIVAIGYQTLLNNTGLYNTAVGHQSLTLATGGYNTALGYQSGDAILGGTYNTLLGCFTGHTITTGHYNIAVGEGALSGGLITGGCNTAVGRRAGHSLNANTANSVYIGYEAGKGRVVSNRLYINNTNSAFPLIYGEFNNDVVKFGNNSDAWNIQFMQSRIHMLETTTPGAIANYGAIYCKADNKLYFQDGAGAEHEVAFV